VVLPAGAVPVTGVWVEPGLAAAAPSGFACAVFDCPVSADVGLAAPEFATADLAVPVARFCVAGVRPASLVGGAAFFSTGGGWTPDGFARLRSVLTFLGLSLLSGGFAMEFPVTAGQQMRSG
jgi:hypothetical protein